MEDSQKQIVEALDVYFSKDRKFIDTSRIPLICQDISGIHKSLLDIKETLNEKVVTQDQFWPIKTIVYTGVGIVLAAVLTGVLGAIFIK